jgi:hypothetical protein
MFLTGKYCVVTEHHMYKRRADRMSGSSLELYSRYAVMMVRTVLVGGSAAVDVVLHSVKGERRGH